MQLSDMKVGDAGRIKKFMASDAAYRKRLIAMGLLPGTAFTISRIAPLGDPIEIAIRGFFLSLRKHEASIIDVEKIK